MDFTPTITTQKPLIIEVKYSTVTKSIGLSSSSNNVINTITPVLTTNTKNGSWQELGPTSLSNTNNIPTWGSGPFSGRVTAIAINGTNSQEIYVGTAQGGVWKTLNGGSTWTPLMDQMNSLAVGSLAISPDNHTLYVGTGEGNLGGDNYAGIGLLKSTNEGQSWSILGSNYFNGSSISSIAIRNNNPNYILVSTTVGGYAKGLAYGYNSNGIGIYLSTNGGSTWSLRKDLSSYLGVAQLLVNTSNDNIIYASDYYGTIWRSSDGGLTWGSYWTNSSYPGRISIAMTPANLKNLYAIFSDFNTGEIVSIGYTDGSSTTTFNPLPAPNSNQYGPCSGQCWYDLTINVDPTNANTIYIGTNNLYKSTTGGSSWSFLGGAEGNGYLHPDMHAFAFAPGNPSVIYSGNDGGIYKSTNAGSTWTSLNTNLGTLQLVTVSASPTNDAHLIAGAQDNACELYTNSTTWTIASSGDGAGTAFFTDTAMACNYVNLYPDVSSDNGLTFINVTDGLNFNDYSQFYAPMAQDPNNPNILYFGSNRIYKMTYPTLSWADLSGIITSGTYSITSIAVSKTHPNELLEGDSQGNVKLSTSGGSTWNTVLAQSIPVTSVAIDPFNSSILYASFATTTNPQFYYSLDQGSSWNPFSLTNVPNVAINVIKVNPVSDTLFIGTDRGMYYLNNSGSWNLLGSGLPNAAIFDFTFTASNYLVVATHGRGAWLNYITPVVTLNKPTVNGTSMQGGKYLSITISDPNGFTNGTYHWDQNSNTTVLNSFNTTLPASEGQHILYVYAKDVSGNWVKKDYVFFTDNTPPTVTLSTITNDTSIPPLTTVDFNLFDTNSIQNVQFSWNGNANETATVIADKISITAPSIAGQAILQIYAEDSAGNIGFTTFIFVITQPTTTPPSSSQPISSQPISSQPITSSSGSPNTQSKTSSKLPSFELTLLMISFGLIVLIRRKQTKK